MQPALKMANAVCIHTLRHVCPLKSRSWSSVSELHSQDCISDCTEGPRERLAVLRIRLGKLGVRHVSGVCTSCAG